MTWERIGIIPKNIIKQKYIQIYGEHQTQTKQTEVHKKMANIQEALESNFLTVEVVRNSPSKQCVVVDPGSYEDDDYGNHKLSMKVNIDGKIKKWRPNITTVTNLKVLGMDTNEWLGKVIALSIEKQGGKELVIGNVGVVAQPAPTVPVVDQLPTTQTVNTEGVI